MQLKFCNYKEGLTFSVASLFIQMNDNYEKKIEVITYNLFVLFVKDVHVIVGQYF